MRKGTWSCWYLMGKWRDEKKGTWSCCEEAWLPRSWPIISICAHLPNPDCQQVPFLPISRRGLEEHTWRPLPVGKRVANESRYQKMCFWCIHKHLLIITRMGEFSPHRPVLQFLPGVLFHYYCITVSHGSSYWKKALGTLRIRFSLFPFIFTFIFSIPFFPLWHFICLGKPQMLLPGAPYSWYNLELLGLQFYTCWVGFRTLMHWAILRHF